MLTHFFSWGPFSDKKKKHFEKVVTLINVYIFFMYIFIKKNIYFVNDNYLFGDTTLIW